MDKNQLIRLLKRLPDDATEISIPQHNSNELIFNSDLITKKNADEAQVAPAQRGTYNGLKRRWRIKDEFQQSLVQPPNVAPELTGSPINLSDIPEAPANADKTNG